MINIFRRDSKPAATLSVGFPAALAVLLVCFSISLMSSLLFNYENGEALNSAYNVTAKCGTIALHISIGIAQGVMPLIGYSYGAKNHRRVHEVCRLLFIILFIFSVLFFVDCTAYSRFDCESVYKR